jgi:hypothetical protein
VLFHIPEIPRETTIRHTDEGYPMEVIHSLTRLLEALPMML